MECTHILSLPTQLLVKILWHTSQSIMDIISDGSESGDYKFLSTRGDICRGRPSIFPEKSITLAQAPLASADVAWNLLVASVCRDWRRLAERHVSSISVREDLAVSRQDLASAVTRFPSLTHLHLHDGSAECVDDAFLAHLASTCPKLRALHVGTRINLFHRNPRIQVPEDSHPITEAVSVICQAFPVFPYLLTTVLGRDADSASSPPLQLPSLRSLRVNGICQTFFDLFPSGSPGTDLQLLEIASVSAAEILPADIGELMPCVRELSLFRCASVTELPEELTSLARLESLRISSCTQISRLPRNLGELSALKRLELFALPLTALPDSLAQLTRLEFSLLECQGVRRLPAEFSCLTALETLYLGQMLPDGIGKLSNLKTLLLEEHGHVQRLLPSSFTQLSLLTRLELNRSTIEELPQDIAMLSSLQHLCLCSCPNLRMIHDSVSGLTGLEILVIDNCYHLTPVPGLDAFTRLKRLEVVHCVAEPPASLPPSLEFLAMPMYSQRAPPSTMPHLPHLRSLELSKIDAGSNLAAITSACRLRRLKLQLVGEAEDLPSPFPHLPHLHVLLILESPKLRRLPERIGSLLPQLRELVVQNSSLRRLPASVCELQCLTSLEIRGCIRLAPLPHDIGVLTRLRRLSVCFCRFLGELPDSLTQLTCLQELNAGFTCLHSLPSGFARLSRLRRLYLNGCENLEALPEEVTELRMLCYLGVRDCPQLLNSDNRVDTHGVDRMYGLEVDDLGTVMDF
ncbi:unnamed protein product [Closterium sp. NIES-65]|nr:unnamed protein product [Closterium sp. NIES-65]